MLLPQCWRLRAQCLFFFLKTVYLVNSEEPESQNCCSRNHFEKDILKDLALNQLYPNHVLSTVLASGDSGSTTESWNGLGGKGP